jgi:hypothetical protein
MKIKTKFFSDVPINIIIIPVLLIFLLQAFMSMFYNNNNLTFYSIHSFHSLAKAEALSSSNFTNFDSNIPGLKEINGFLYPVIISIFIKIVGKYNIIPVLYIISFFVFLLVSIIFYKISNHFLSEKHSIWATIIFIISAPVFLSFYSGADIILVNLLFVLNVYFIYFYLPAKKYKFPIIISVLLLFTTWTGIIYGICCLIYIILSINEKKLKEDYEKNISVFLLLFSLLIVFLCGFVFIENLSPSFFEQNDLLNNTTFFVSAFFKDGFLWSKLTPPFFGILFFVSLFCRFNTEFKEKKISFITFVLIITIASFFIEFFAIFSNKTDTLLFISPFFFLLILFGIDGLFYFADLIQVRNSFFSKNNLILGLILFVILYNIVLSFTLTIEKNNDIRQQHGNMYVEKFFEK